MSGKTKEEIAFDLVSKLKGVGVWGENNKAQILDMYAECLEATSGLRNIDGKTPSALRLPSQGTAPSQSASPKAAAQTAASAVRQAVPPQQPAAPQPQVRHQQQMVQQAYQQQQPPVAR